MLNLIANFEFESKIVMFDYYSLADLADVKS